MPYLNSSNDEVWFPTFNGSSWWIFAPFDPIHENRRSRLIMKVIDGGNPAQRRTIMEEFAAAIGEWAMQQLEMARFLASIPINSNPPSPASEDPMKKWHQRSKILEKLEENECEKCGKFGEFCEIFAFDLKKWLVVREYSYN